MFTGKLSLTKDHWQQVITYLLLLLFSIFASFIIFSPSVPKNIHLKAGDIAKETIISPQYIAFESSSNKLKNNQKLQRVKNSIQPVYTINHSINHSVIQNILLFFEELKTQEMDTLGVNITGLLSQEELQELKSLDLDTLNTVQKHCKNISTTLLAEGIKEKDPKRVQALIDKTFPSEAEPLKLTLSKIILHYLSPNLTIDQKQSEQLRDKAINAIQYEKSIYKEGQPIIYQSEVVTESHIEVFKALNIYNIKTNTQTFLSIFIFSILSMYILERFIHTFNLRIFSPKYIFLIVLVMLLVICMGRFVITIDSLPKHSLHFLLTPIPISAMLLSILVTPNIALITGTLIALLTCFMFPSPFEPFLFLFFCNCITTFCIYKLYKRSELIVSGYIIGGFNILIVLGIGLFSEQHDYMWYIVNALFAFGNGVLSAMITLAILPYFESIFKITTSQTLLELSNLNHPLLKRLMMNAPGTYQHSLMVANLAEAAAEAINANTIICRVGSYFHDIGKLKRPIFFIENQFSEENPHNSLAPRISKMIIISHVKDGIEMAEKHKLPSILVDIIAQHHGTSLLSFFYSQALANEGENNSQDEEFRYPGPKPSSKEAGIIMLADSVEAATRSIQKPTPQKIENMIHKIFQIKLEDQQLSECPLSFNEIDMIKATFLSLFKGMGHGRLDYQSEIDKLNSNSSKPTEETNEDSSNTDD